jgi:protein-disulfide isomerase
MPRTAEAVLTMPVSEDRDHILGPSSAPVTLVEYGDFQCSHCGQAHYELQELAKEAGDRFRLVFRHFPMTQIHPNAQRAAEASEVAAAQGQFWPMHDTLFEKQDALDDHDLVMYAHELGLDVMRFRMELLEGRYTPRVREDFLSGVRSGVNGTPTFFINGRRHDGPWDAESLLVAIKEAAPRPQNQRFESRRPTARRRSR